MPKVSVIIPVYNVEQYLEECLGSVCGQTLKEIEIICVNDGSADACPKILEAWAVKDRRIKVLHQENKGYGRAVNRGIETAIGDYVGIVEPDDYIQPEMMEALYVSAVQNDVDLVKADFEMFWGDGQERRTKQEKIMVDDSLYGRQLKPGMELRSFLGWVANWSGIYRRSFLLENQIWHNETPGASYQDHGFWFQAYALAEKAFFVPDTYYKYRQDNPNSSIRSREKVFCISDEYNYIYQRLSKRPECFIPVLPVYIYIKYETYRHNYNRIEDTYKACFLEQFSKEFRQHEKNGELDLEYFDDREKREIRFIMESPGLYPRMREYEILADFFDRLPPDKNIWIYGAGKIAEETWELLAEENKARVKGVLVSVLDGNKEEFHGFQITLFEEAWMEREKDYMILVAVSLKNSEAIVESFKKNHIQEYVLIKEQLS